MLRIGFIITETTNTPRLNTLCYQQTYNISHYLNLTQQLSGALRTLGEVITPEVTRKHWLPT